jgi:DNA-binding MarR family transcriptional regulator
VNNSLNSFADLTDVLIRIIHQAVDIEKTPVDIGYGDVLSASEIHLIDIAGRYPQEKLSEIATRLGITKGAVTQMVQKLEEKGYVRRVRSTENKKMVFLDLTQKGMRAFQWHTDLHARLYADFLKEISDMPEEQITGAISILRCYEKILQRSMEIRDSPPNSE